MSENVRDVRVLTNVALAYKKAADCYLELGHLDKVKEALAEAAEQIKFDAHHPLHDLENYDKAQEIPTYFLGGAQHIRKHAVRVSNMNIDGQEFVEVSAGAAFKSQKGDGCIPQSYSKPSGPRIFPAERLSPVICMMGRKV